MKIWRYIAMICLFFGACGEARAVSFAPIAKLSALGGQYFTGATHSNGANIDASLVPVIGFTPQLYLIPIYLGSYHQTQSVYNFLGQNTLIQTQFDQTGVLRLAWAASSDWRIKPRAGYKKEWIKESSDESLWNGLFSFSRAFGGVSAERVMANGSWELGYEYSDTRYPNYQSLLANPALTATGITSNSGRNVLNFHSHESSLNYQIGPENKRWAFNANFTWVREDFVDQKVITTDNHGIESFVNKRRTDDIFVESLNNHWKKGSHWGLNTTETIQYYLSNQNSFDANQIITPFTYRYYNFIDVQWNPGVVLDLDGNRWEITLGGTLGYRQYTHRRAQDGTGANEDQLIHSMNRGGSLGVRYRLWKKLFMTLTGNVVTYSSNTRFEANYPYNYTVATYLGGLSWEY